MNRKMRSAIWGQRIFLRECCISYLSCKTARTFKKPPTGYGRNMVETWRVPQSERTPRNLTSLGLKWFTGWPWVGSILDQSCRGCLYHYHIPWTEPKQICMDISSGLSALMLDHATRSKDLPFNPKLVELGFGNLKLHSLREVFEKFFIQ